MIDETENNNDLRQTMQMIIFSGDARKFIMQALDLVGEAKYDKSEQLLKQAHEKLVTAHALQTDKIQKEAEGEKLEYSILFTHAQDTMMSVNTEYNLVKHLIEVFKKREQ